MSVLDEVLAANDAYASDFGEKGSLALPPARGFAILTCMDARLDPAKYAGLSEGDAHVIRNAGGRASDDAIRSLVISHKLLGTAEWFVIHHTNCGMEFFTNEIMGDLLESSLETAALGDEGFYDVGEGPGSPEGKNIDWLTISDQRRPSSTTSRRSATTRSSRAPSRSTATSTTSRRASSSRFPPRPRPVARRPANAA